MEKPLRLWFKQSFLGSTQKSMNPKKKKKWNGFLFKIKKHTVWKWRKKHIQGESLQNIVYKGLVFTMNKEF